MRLTKVMNCF